jgi:hypothetical protein
MDKIPDILSKALDQARKDAERLERLRKKTPPPVSKLPIPPGHSAGEQGSQIFAVVKWSNEEPGAPPEREGLFNNNGGFDIDFSAMKQQPTTPQLQCVRSDSNWGQGTKLGGGVLVVKDSTPAGVWHSSPVAFVDRFTVQGVAYTPGEAYNMGVLLAAWAYIGGMLLSIQWDDVGWNESGHSGPDYDYNDSELFLWLPVSQPFTVKRDPRALVLNVIPT